MSHVAKEADLKNDHDSGETKRVKKYDPQGTIARLMGGPRARAPSAAEAVEDAENAGRTAAAESLQQLKTGAAEAPASPAKQRRAAGAGASPAKERGPSAAAASPARERGAAAAAASPAKGRGNADT